MVLALWLLPLTARAWIETRILGDDVRVEVDPSGMAVVEHAITMRVRGGPLRHFDLVGADRDAVPLDEAQVVSTRAGSPEAPIPLSVSERPDGALRVNIEHPRGLRRGTYLFRFRYRTNLLATGALERDGALLRLDWAGPIWPDGVGNVRTTFVLPPATTAPRSAADESRPELGSEADPNPRGAFLEEVRRLPDRDEIELLRPHIARREQAIWSIRIDPRALAATTDARLKPPAPPPPQKSPFERALGWMPWAAAAFVGFSLLSMAKGRHVRAACHAKGADERPLLPLTLTARSLLGGLLFASGLVLQMAVFVPLLGTLLLLLAASLTIYRTPRWKPRLRGPGRWLPITDADAFAKTPRLQHGLDYGTPRGRLFFALSLLSFAAISALAFRFSSPYHGYLVAFDAALLFPIFGTGRLDQLPPHPTAGAAKLLRKAARSLRRHEFLKVVPWARLPEGSDTFDELRLLVVPRLPLRGFGAIEVGVAWAPGAGGALAKPRVLVRVVEGSACQEELTRALGKARWTPGRKPDERVTILTPKYPTAAKVAELALDIAKAARDLEKHSEKPRAPKAPTASAPRRPAPESRPSAAG